MAVVVATGIVADGNREVPGRTSAAARTRPSGAATVAPQQRGL